MSGRLLLYNAQTMSFRELKLRPNPDRSEIKELIDYEQFCGIPQTQEEETDVPEMTVHELKQLMEQKSDDYVLIDV
ncbi:adenylyltransferase/sulfurtransferase MoeZ, partial [Halomonas sp. SIMBA_159]